MGETLSKPQKEKHTSTFETKRLRVGCCGMQGWRKNMEDAHLSQLNLQGDPKSALFGVYDGHNGNCVAKYCGLYMAEHLLNQVVEYEAKRYGDAFVKAYLDIDGTLQNNPDYSDGGCTAVSVLLIDSKLICASAGDSRAILYRTDGEIVALSEDHKPSRPSEQERIRKAGGSVEQGRVNGLSLTRAIGDFSAKTDTTRSLADQVITAKPDISETPLTPEKDKYLIIACDGVWDVVSNKECAAFVVDKMAETAKESDDGEPDVGRVCEMLLDRCCATVAPGIGTDNMTVIVVEFKPEYWN
eukprot:Tbor_TRINITY_DN5708_c1_g2::TRINITY_DN5708_c1_g2_i3::g.19964::m.19964/K14803/PTC2_3; protein phosphatase PTC2/3